VPYNPQQNGVVQRKNGTIFEVAKAMVFDQDLPNSLWAEATSTSVYIQNKCPHAILKDKTPEEVLSGIKPEVGHLRIFGCPVYIHVPKEKRTKISKVSFDYVPKIMKHESHGTLKGCSDVFKAERHLPV
jgi:hypothetical protein